MHPCQRIYQLGAGGLIYGNTPGICRITADAAVGLPFAKWVKDTFTDHGYLRPGTIISNEALFSFDEKSVEASQHYTKRFDMGQSDLIDFRGKVGRVITERGHYKSLFNRVYYRHALYVDWYVLGDTLELENLLRYCTHIGKKPAQGYGAVLRWEVIEWPVDWSETGPEGRLMRAVPQDSGKGPLYGIRPSYWLPKHQFRCQMP